MTAKITEEITSRNYELIRDRIAAILTVEIAEQLAITGNNLFDAVVWTERFISFDKTELPAVNVYFFSNRYEEHTPISNVADNTYHIDIHVHAKHTSGSDYLNGDKEASKKCQKMAGVIQTILEHPGYLKLDFDSNIIRHTKVNDIQISQPADSQDGLHTVTGRVTFNVVSTDIEPELSAIEAEKYTTQVNLGETDKGFYYETKN